MRIVLTTMGAAAVAIAAAVFLPAAQASAEPGFDPCGGSVLCRFVPIYPNLDHDVDLTKDPSALIDAGPAPGNPLLPNGG